MSGRRTTGTGMRQRRPKICKKRWVKHAYQYVCDDPKTKNPVYTCTRCGDMRIGSSYDTFERLIREQISDMIKNLLQDQTDAFWGKL